MPLNITKPEPYIATIDGEQIRLNFKRMNVREFEEFEAFFHGYSERRQSPSTTEATALSNDEHHQQLRERAAYATANAEWILDTFERFVTIDPGALSYDGEPVTSGARFVEIFIGQSSLLIDVLVALYMENKLTAAQKKILRSLPGFANGSPVPNAAANGPTPETVAASVESADLNKNAGVTDVNSDESSGTVGQSSYAAVPFGS